MSKVYKRLVTEGLKDLSSYDFQKLAWFETSHGHSSSFSEDVEAIFDETGLKSALARGEVIFGNRADQALRELEIMVDQVGYHRSEYDLIDSPEMAAIRQKAAIALVLVEACDGSESTVEIVDAP